MKFLLAAVAILIMQTGFVLANGSSLKAEVTVGLSDGTRLVTEVPFQSADVANIPLVLDSAYGVCVMKIAPEKVEKKGETPGAPFVFIEISQVKESDTRRIFSSYLPLSFDKDMVILKTSMAPGKETPEMRPFLQSIAVKISALSEK